MISLGVSSGDTIRTMQIGILTSSFLPQIGGLEWKVHFLATEYRRLGHEVTVFHRRSRCRHAGPLPFIPSYRITPIWPRPFPGYVRTGIEGWFFTRQVLAMHQHKPFDLLHCHVLEVPTRYGLRVKQATGLPVVATTCGYDIMTCSAIGYGARLQPYYDRIVRDNVRRVDVLGSISSAITAALRSIGTRARIVQIPNGVDWDAFQVKADGWLRKRLGCEQSDVLVLSIGRNHRVKDYLTGIRAFAQAAGADPRIHYVLIGKGMADLAPLVDSLNLKARVHLLDGISMADVPKVLWDCDVFFSTSLMEGFPQVVAQAMACARPCVLSDCPGNEDLKGHPCALFGRVGDSASLAIALKQLFSDPGARRRMGQEAHTESRRFSWGCIAEEYLAIFEELVKGTPWSA